MRVVLLVGAVEFILSAVGYLYYRCTLPWGKSWFFGLPYLLLTLNAAASRAVSPLLPHSLDRLSAWLDGLWVAFAYYTVLFALLHLLLWLITRIFSWHLPAGCFSACAMAIACCLVGWGTWRAMHPIERVEQIVTDKLPADAHYRIIFLTDVHLGRIMGHSCSQQLVQRINSLQPDIVLFAGDLIDEKIAYVLEEDSLRPLAQLKAAKGSFLAFGNHEYIDNPSLWQQLVQQQGITVLRDASAIIDGRIKLAGLNDYSRSRTNASLWDLAADNDQYYSILLDHQPRKMEAAARAEYDLYLAGHTHTGQLFPNRIITRLMYKLDYGRKNFGRLTAITSSGYGFWGPPVRTEALPEIVVLEIRGK